MTLRGLQGAIVLFLSALVLSSEPPLPRAELAPIARDFRNLCQSLKMKCARSSPAKKTRAASKGKSTVPRNSKPVKKPVASPAPTVEKIQSVVPVPRSKPSAIEALSSPAKTNTIINKTPPPKKNTETQIATVARPQKDMTTAVEPVVPPSVPDNGCLVSLKNSGAEFESLTSVGDGRCHVDVPVRLHSVTTTSGKIVLPESPIVSCRFARQFALWLSDTGAALVSTHLDMKLAKVSTGPGYECRGRNGDASGKLSEHAFGNAVDITTITTADGRKIQISDAGNSASPSFQVLRGLRTTACGYFSTVLGPGSNEAHASHFHFDIGMHGRSKNYRICE